MLRVLYFLCALFVLTGIAEWLEKQVYRWKEKHPRLNYRKQWM